MQDKMAITPLHIASESKAKETVLILCEHNADVNMQDKYGATPLHIAA